MLCAGRGGVRAAAGTDRRQQDLSAMDPGGSEARPRTSSPAIGGRGGGEERVGSGALARTMVAPSWSTFSTWSSVLACIAWVVGR